MKILIVGGGVAGPALAGFLKDQAEITLIEKAPEWGNIGFAIALWSNGQKILHELGIAEEVLAGGFEIPRTCFYNHRGKLLKEFTFDMMGKAGSSIVVTRSALQQALTKKIENTSVRIKMSTTIKTISQDETSVRVVFSDEGTDTFDVVIGADGIHSQVRDLMFGPGFFRYYGWTFYAFWSSAKTDPPKDAFEVSSAGKVFIVDPMGKRAVIIIGIATEPKPIDKEPEHPVEDLRKLFADYTNPIVREQIDALDESTHILRENLAHVVMSGWSRGRIALMGDAQHAITPLLGMGATMALEDAYVLADELRKNPANIQEALKGYERRRERRATQFEYMSRQLQRRVV